MKNINMIKVESSNVKSVGYLDNNLYVEYNNREYVYENVPKVVYESLLTAPSKGKFLNEQVKGKYNYKPL